MNDQDSIDRMLAGWRRARPDVDVRSLAVVQRLIRGGRRADKRPEDQLAIKSLRVRGDYETLAALRRAHPESLTPQQLAAETQVSSAGMTSRLDRLEVNGYVARAAALSDRRSVNVTLTDEGLELIDALFAVSVAEQARAEARRDRPTRRAAPPHPAQPRRPVEPSRPDRVTLPVTIRRPSLAELRAE